VETDDALSTISEEELKTRIIPFLKFPLIIRLRIYYFLGYPISTKHAIPIIRSGRVFELRQRYNVNYCPGAILSQPWNFGHGVDGESDGRHKHITPEFFAPILSVNKEIMDELYEFLFGQAMFDVTLNGWRYIIPVTLRSLISSFY
jgi:hypothetical protein